MKIGILGSGTWGMALARMLFNAGHSVLVWSISEDEINTYKGTHRHPHLAGMEIPEGIEFTLDIANACLECDIIVLAVPSPFVRATAERMLPYINDAQIIVDVAKGIEAETLCTMTRVIDDVLRSGGKRARTVALSGPTHAEEVALDMPTTIVAACEDIATAERVQGAFMTENMRVYTNTDVLGVELCGAIKNVIALAAGISKGIGFGDNAKAALITRGIAEMTRLGVAMGCNIQTFAGLAGIGDLIVTATSEHSRNNRAGQLIGSGMSAADAIRAVGMVVEGINALPAVIKLSHLHGVDMPIACGIDRIINHGISPRDVVYELMTRPRKNELTV